MDQKQTNLDRVTTLEPRRQLAFGADSEIEIAIAPNAGACFGVVRAIKLGHQALKKAQGVNSVYSLGPLIHNPTVVKNLENSGVKTVHQPLEVEAGTVLLRSHGVQKEVEADLKARGINIVDATCPLVKKPQRIAASIAEQGRFLILVGDLNHPEVKGVISYFARDNYLVTYNPADIDRIPANTSSIGIIAQTTIEVSVLNQVVEKARERFTDVAVFNTICDATSIRQSEAIQLAQTAEVVVVVGGKNSSNTCKLVKICKEYQPCTYHIEEIEEIETAWFLGKRKIGVTGGASTPHDFVNSVGNHIASLMLADA